MATAQLTPSSDSAPRANAHPSRQGGGWLCLTQGDSLPAGPTLHSPRLPGLCGTPKSTVCWRGQEQWHHRPAPGTYRVLGPLAAAGRGHHLQLGVIGQVGEPPLQREVEHAPLKPATQSTAHSHPQSPARPVSALCGTLPGAAPARTGTRQHAFQRKEPARRQDGRSRLPQLRPGQEAKAVGQGLMFTRGHISLMVAFEGLNVIQDCTNVTPP